MSKVLFAKRLIALAGIAGPLLWGSVANANTIDIGLQQAGVNGGAITTVASGDGVAVIAALPYGTFNSNTIQALGLPFIGPSDLLSSQALNVSSAVGGTLNVFVSELDVPLSGITPFISSFTAQLGPLFGLVSVAELTWISASNTAYALTTLLGSKTFTDIGTDVQTTVLNLANGLYSVTHEYTVTLAPNGASNATIDVTATPVPAALPLFGSVLAGGLLFGKFRRRKASAQPATA